MEDDELVDALASGMADDDTGFVGVLVPVGRPNDFLTSLTILLVTPVPALLNSCPICSNN